MATAKQSRKNREGKIAIGILNNREQHLLASSNKCGKQYQLTTQSNTMYNKEQYQLKLDQEKYIEGWELKK